MNKFLFTDSKGNKSVTVTAFVIGFIIVNLKLLLSGMTLEGFSMSAFTGTEYGIAVAALGSIYILRRTHGKSPKKED